MGGLRGAAPRGKRKKGRIAAEFEEEGRREQAGEGDESRTGGGGRTLRSRGMKESRVAAEGLVMLADETRRGMVEGVRVGGMTRWRVGGRRG